LSAGEVENFRKNVGGFCAITPMYHVMRFCPMRQKEYRNLYFTEFCEKFKVEFHHSYRQAKPNMQAAWKGVAKFDRGEPLLCPDVWHFSNFLADRFLFQMVVGSDLLTYEDSVKRLDLTTSPGYPHTLHWPSKREMFAGTDVGAVCDAHWENLLIGDTNTFWTCSQKHELRAVEKLSKNSIRLFTAAPVEVTICDNRLFGDFNDRVIKHYGKCWIQVGMSQFCGGWHSLAVRLSRLPFKYRLDFHNFDGSETVALFSANLRFRYASLKASLRTVETKLRMTNAYRNMLSGYCVLETGLTFQKILSMNSGWVNTIIDNSMAVVRIVVYGWCMVAPSDMLNLASLLQHVECAIYGDDLILCVSSFANTFFNAGVLRKICANEFNMELTSEDNFEPVTIDKLTFLHHGFRKERGMYYLVLILTV